jgi:hypothetical protein
MSKPPFILPTGRGGQIAEDHSTVRIGVERVVYKPILIPKLLQVLHEVCSREQTTHPLLWI